MLNKLVMMTVCVKLDFMSINQKNKIVWMNKKIINKNNKKIHIPKLCIKLFLKKPK
jgi:hypothetical protein